jgi:glycosyltransferase involved in cell wall biosynthesis
MRVLLSAYACEPGKGSEPGVGWNWARMIAQDHEAWVLTRSNNRAAIEAALAADPRPNLRFIYVAPPAWLTWWKRGHRGVRLFYLLWQVWALMAARRAHRERPFDLVHHLTFANAYVPALTCLLPVPFVWGPVGGATRPCWRLAGEWGPRGVAYELLRAGRRGVGRWLDPFMRLTWSRATCILTQNHETMRWLPRRIQARCRVVPNGGYDARQLVRPPVRRDRRIRVITPGRLVHLKGVSLAVRAMAATRIPGLELTVVGDGPERGRLERLARQLGVEVTFTGWLPQARLFELLACSDVLLFPSLHDECGFVVMEAMAHGLIPVVVANGGPPLVAGDAGLSIPFGGRAVMVEALASRLRALGADPELRSTLQERARRRAQAFEWGARAVEIQAMYAQLLTDRRSIASLRSSGRRLGEGSNG